MRFSHCELLLVGRSIYNITIIMHRLDTWLRSIGQIRRRRAICRTRASDSIDSGWTHTWKRERKLRKYRHTAPETREKRTRTKSGEVEKMIFNISNRLHLITRIVRAGTCNSARGWPCACVHEHARSFDGFPFVRETESKVKKKERN